MTNYSLALFFHFVGLAMLFIGYGLEWIVSAFLRGAVTTDQVRADAAVTGSVQVQRGLRGLTAYRLLLGREPEALLVLPEVSVAEAVRV